MLRATDEYQVEEGGEAQPFQSTFQQVEIGRALNLARLKQVMKFDTFKNILNNVEMLRYS